MIATSGRPFAMRGVDSVLRGACLLLVCALGAPAGAQDKYPLFGVHMGAPAELVGPGISAGAQLGRAGGSDLSRALARYEQQWFQNQKKVTVKLRVRNDAYPNSDCMANDPGDDGKRLMKMADANARQRFTMALCDIDNAVRVAVRPERALKRGTATVIAHNVTERHLTPRDTPMANYSKWSRSLEGNFHFVHWRDDWDDKWTDSGKPMTRHNTVIHYEAAAGNVTIDAYTELLDGGKPNPVDIRALVEREILPNLPVLKGAWKVEQPERPKPEPAPVVQAPPESRATVEVLPSLGLDAGSEGLIPATSTLPARIRLRDARPGSEVEFVLAREAPADFGQGAKSLTMKANASGEAAASFWYRGAAEGALNGPLEIPLAVRAEGRNFRASVHVGLGLSLDRISAPQGEKPPSGANLPFPLMVSVKSVWRPNLDISTWLAGAESGDVWGGRTIAVRLAGVWLNRPENEAQLDETYDGVTRIVPLTGGARANFLAARARPVYRGARFEYPAIVMKTLGVHMYRLAGSLQVVDAKTDAVVERETGERFVIAQTVTMLSWQEPESVLQSMACALQPQSRAQYLMIEVAKMVPVYGDIADYAQTGTGLLCALMKSDTEKALIDIAGWAGGKVLDHLTSKEVLDGMSARMQNEVWSAYAAVLGVNRYRDRREVAGLPPLAPQRLPPEETPEGAGPDGVASAPVVIPSVAPAPPVPSSGGQQASGQDKAMDDASRAAAEAGKAAADAGKAAVEAGKAAGKAVGEVLKGLFQSLRRGAEELQKKSEPGNSK